MISTKINGVSRQFHGSADMPLLWYVRDELGSRGPSSGAAWRSVVRAPCTSTASRYEVA